MNVFNNIFLLSICLMLLCSCDTGDTGSTQDNSPTATPKPIPQAVLWSTLKDFQAHFADSYFVNDQGSDIIYFLNPRNIFDFNAPAYDLHLLNGKVYSIEVLSNAHQQGGACAIFIPKDAKLISNTPNNNGAASAAMAIYHSNWLAPQFSPSAFVDQPTSPRLINHNPLQSLVLYHWYGIM